MSRLELEDLNSILEKVKDWPPKMRVSLAHMILETVESPQMPGQTLVESEPLRRGKPVESLIGLGAGNGPPPSDEIVRH
jgi:hypothetical protein